MSSPTDQGRGANEIREYFMCIAVSTFNKTPGWGVAAASVCIDFTLCNLVPISIANTAVLQRSCSCHQSSFLAIKTQTTPYLAKTNKTKHLQPENSKKLSHSSQHPAGFLSCLDCLLTHSLIRSSVENLQGWRFHSFPEHLSQCLTAVTVKPSPCCSLCSLLLLAPLNHLAPSSLQPHLSCGKAAVKSPSSSLLSRLK